MVNHGSIMGTYAGFQLVMWEPQARWFSSGNIPQVDMGYPHLWKPPNSECSDVGNRRYAKATWRNLRLQWQTDEFQRKTCCCIPNRFSAQFKTCELTWLLILSLFPSCLGCFDLRLGRVAPWRDGKLQWKEKGGPFGDVPQGAAP